MESGLTWVMLIPSNTPRRINPNMSKMYDHNGKPAEHEKFLSVSGETFYAAAADRTMRAVAENVQTVMLPRGHQLPEECPNEPGNCLSKVLRKL